jgi:hypothetical protein
MIVEIIFMDASKPKTVDVDDVYTKGGLLCFQYADGLIVKYPLDRIFQIAHQHGKHHGSNRNPHTVGGVR